MSEASAEIPAEAGVVENATQVLRRKKGSPASPVSPSSTLHAAQSGDQLFGFLLRQEIGRGGFAKVYLAEQADLADRPVVLKVSRRDGQEPQLLAQLQHTNIVPIYSVHEDATRGLRAVCMPYFGGANLLEVLRHLWARTPKPTEGKQLAESLRAVGGPLPPPRRSINAERTGPPVIPWESFDFLRTVIWITARLAEALQHAHERGVLHSDIKPSNILLTADGQPMLLDFNVGQEFDPDHDPAMTCLGGTMIYMAPEHLRALGSQSAPNALPLTAHRPIDHRSDLYSLGVVLYELLVGGMPFTSTRSSAPVTTVLMAMADERTRRMPSARLKRPDIPWGLESILKQCLEPDPSKRYQRCEHLAEDLRRLLDDRPLRYAPELSIRERIVKWTRRHPKVLPIGGVIAASLVMVSILGGTLMAVRSHAATMQQELQIAQADDKRRDFERGTLRALCLINTVSDAHDHLSVGIQVCEETLAMYEILDNANWQNHPDWLRLTPNEQATLAENTRELLVLLASARVRANAGNAESVQGALQLLNRAESIHDLPPSRAIWQERARYHELLGDKTAAKADLEQARKLKPASVQDHYLLALSYARAGHYHESINQLTKAVHLQPRHYWALLQRGICYQELGQFTLAAADFGACVGLWPEFAWGSFNRAWALDQGGNKEEAIRDYTAALVANPDLVPAYFNRGMVLIELRRYENALADFQEALGRGRNDASLHLGMAMALEGLNRHPEADEAFTRSRKLAASSTKEVQVRVGWVYGFAVWQRHPQKAIEAFNDVLKLSPEHPQALYGLGMLRSHEGDDRAAVNLFNRAIQARPAFPEARRYRGILLARLGHFVEAQTDVNYCLENDPNGGAAYYAAACVAALHRARLQAPGDITESENLIFSFLQTAFRRGYGKERALTDPDLKSVRDNPRLTQLVQGATKTSQKP